jgi:hypothetical protein
MLFKGKVARDFLVRVFCSKPFPSVQSHWTNAKTIFATKVLFVELFVSEGFSRRLQQRDMKKLIFPVFFLR